MSEKKVLFITYYWPPSGGAGVQRSLKFVKYLPEFGWEPTVLTVNPLSATYPVEDPSLEKDVPVTIPVVRTTSWEPLKFLAFFSGKSAVPYGGFTNRDKEKWTQKLLRFLRGNLLIPDARVGWVRPAVRAAEKLIREHSIGTVVISSPPHSSQLIGLRLKRVFPDLVWVADLRDPWTDIYYYKDMLHLPFARKKDASLEKAVLKSCSAVIVVSDPIRRSFMGKLDDPSSVRFEVLPNGFDRSDFPGEVVPPSEVFRVTYVGTIAESYRPEVFFRAFSSFVREHPEGRIRLRLVGSTSWLMRVLEEEGLLSCLEQTGHVSHQQAVSFMRDSSALLLVIPDTPGAEGILTGKLFEYLGAGIPVIGIGPASGRAAAIVNGCGAGRFFERSEERGVRTYLEELYASWHKNPDLRHHGDVSAFERKSQASVLSGLLDDLRAK
ncbi:MAG: hypothetical protein RL213_1883 [Bacteroidota bacterium]